MTEGTKSGEQAGGLPRAGRREDAGGGEEKDRGGGGVGWTGAVMGHLARLLVHVEGADDALSDLAARALHQVLGQPVGQVGLAGAAGAGEDEAPVLEQEANVVLHHGLGDQRLEHQAVHALLLQTCAQPREHECPRGPRAAGTPTALPSLSGAHWRPGSRVPEEAPCLSVDHVGLTFRGMLGATERASMSLGTKVGVFSLYSSHYSQPQYLWGTSLWTPHLHPRRH